MQIAASEITARGNVVAFTAKDESIVAGRKSLRGVHVWTVHVEGEYGPNLLDSRRRTFETRAEAAAYASTLADAVATERLAWWN